MNADEAAYMRKFLAKASSAPTVGSYAQLDGDATRPRSSRRRHRPRSPSTTTTTTTSIDSNQEQRAPRHGIASTPLPLILTSSTSSSQHSSTPSHLRLLQPLHLSPPHAMETPPHVLAFVQAQASNLPLYATQGAALLNSYLSAQPRQAGLAGGGGGDSRARSGSSDLAAIAPRADDDPRQQQQQQQQQQQPSSPPAPHPLLGAGGVSGVDVLNAARAGESRSSSGPKPVPAGPTAAPTTAGRLVDRMKGRNGTAATGNKAAIRTSSNAKRPAVGTAEPSPEQPAVEAAARAREGSFIQTRAELRRARSGQAPDVKVEVSLKQHPLSSRLREPTLTRRCVVLRGACRPPQG